MKKMLAISLILAASMAGFSTASMARDVLVGDYPPWAQDVFTEPRTD